MKRLTRTRFAMSALVCAFVLASFTPTIEASALSTEFPVSAAQIQTLGVALQKLSAPASVAGLGYPAKVVLQRNDEAVVSAPVAGVVDRVLVNGQESVKRGQPLLRLASPDYAEAQLKLLEAADRARLSRRTLVREKSLFDEGIIAERRLQEADSAARLDSARLRQAQTTLRLMGADAATIKRVAGGGSVDEALVLLAPADAFVVKVDVRAGQRVAASDALIATANPKELWLEIQVPSGQSVPTNAEITVDGRTAVARLQASGNVVGEAQTLTLRAKVVRGSDSLRAGEVVQARVPTSNQAGWVLPLSSMTRQDGKSYVFVRTNKGFSPVPVTVLNTTGQSVQVSGTLSAGQEVATTSVIALKAAWLGKGGGE